MAAEEAWREEQRAVWREEAEWREEQREVWAEERAEREEWKAWPEAHTTGFGQ